MVAQLILLGRGGSQREVGVVVVELWGTDRPPLGTAGPWARPAAFALGVRARSAWQSSGVWNPERRNARVPGSDVRPVAAHVS